MKEKESFGDHICEMIALPNMYPLVLLTTLTPWNSVAGGPRGAEEGLPSFRKAGGGQGCSPENHKHSWLCL